MRIFVKFIRLILTVISNWLTAVLLRFFNLDLDFERFYHLLELVEVDVVQLDFII